MQDREPLSRREFLKGAGVAAGALLVPNFLQETPEPPETDPFLASDIANIEAINSRIEALGSNILEEREWADEMFELQDPRLEAIIKLDTRLAPDISFGALASGEGEVYALVYNHNMDCMRDPLASEGELMPTLLTPGPATGRFEPGVREIQTTPVQPQTRLDSMTVERFIDEVTVSVNNQELTLPVLVVRDFTFSGQEYDCPTLRERAGGALGGLLDRAQELAGDIDVGDMIESAGEAIGNAIGRFRTGLGRGAGN